MRFTTSSLAASAFVAGASAQNYLGFNCGSTKTDNTPKVKADFVQEFTTAQNLVGAPGNFNAMRLYTNIQGGSTNDPIEAFEAAIQTNTKLLLGVWASGTTNINNEVTALQSAVKTYGTNLTDLVIGCSIGSEDLYRNSVTGMTNNAGIGNDPEVIAGFISDFKKAFAGTGLASCPMGHVDTWDAWTNGTNNPVLDAVDWLGVDEYPYYQNGTGNTIDNAANLFLKAYDAVVAVAGNKKVWVTETGWPVTGPTWDQGVPSVNNSKTYWDTVGCAKLFGETPTFWYTLSEANGANLQSFGITNDLSTTPLFNLTCPAVSKDTTTTGDDNSTSTSSSSSSQSTGTNTGSSSTSATSSGSTATGTHTGAAASLQVLSVSGYACLAIIAGLMAFI